MDPAQTDQHFNLSKNMGKESFHILHKITKTMVCVPQTDSETYLEFEIVYFRGDGEIFWLEFCLFVYLFLA